jgi:uncharacterized membrane protein
MLHLLHPPTVHFAVAFLVLGGLCEAWGILGGNDRYERFGGVLVLIGTVCLILTVATGLLAAKVAALPDGVSDDLTLHERIGYAILGLFGLCAFAKAWVGGTLKGRARTIYAVALLVGVGLVIFGAFQGGHLVYQHGVGVAP